MEVAGVAVSIFWTLNEITLTEGFREMWEVGPGPGRRRKKHKLEPWAPWPTSVQRFSGCQNFSPSFDSPCLLIGWDWLHLCLWIFTLSRIYRWRNAIFSKVLITYRKVYSLNHPARFLDGWTSEGLDLGRELTSPPLCSHPRTWQGDSVNRPSCRWSTLWRK